MEQRTAGFDAALGELSRDKRDACPTGYALIAAIRTFVPTERWPVRRR